VNKDYHIFDTRLHTQLACGDIVPCVGHIHWSPVGH